MLSLALLAASLDHQMQQSVQQMQQTVQQALRLAMIRLLEGVEYAQAHQAYQAATQQATEYQQAAQEYQQAAARDAFYAHRQRERGQYLQQLGDMEGRDAAMHAAMAQQDDQERLALLHNISNWEQDENATLTELREIHKGACGWKVVQSLCSTVGGATQLQERAHADYLEIHNEWKQAQELKRQQVMQTMVADMLTAKSVRYNESAIELQQIAQQWDERAQQDYDIARADNRTAAKLWKQADRDYAIMKRDELGEAQIDIMEDRLMQRADVERAAAYGCAVGAILCATVALLFFGARLVPQTQAAWQAWEANQTDATASLAYIGVHILIFLGVTGITGMYLVHMERYTAIQRAVILMWFATLASLTQSVTLHAMPWAWQELSSPRETAPVVPFVIEISTRYVIFFFMFLLELLIVWLALGHGLFQVAWVQALASWPFRLLVVGAVVAYGCSIEAPRRQVAAGEDTSTLGSGSAAWPENQSIFLASGSASQAVSEVTPLRKADLMSWGTTIDMAIDGSVGTPPSRQAALTTSSSLYRDLWQDLLRLVFPLEILLVACMIAVLRNAVHMVWISHATWIQYFVLLCALGLVLFAFWLAREAAYSGEQTGWTKRTDHELMDTPGSFRMPPKFEMVQV